MSVVPAAVRVCVAMLLSAPAALAQGVSPDWFRSPTVSPDGETVVFTHAGDLYSVPIEGGRAGDPADGAPGVRDEPGVLAQRADDRLRVGPQREHGRVRDAGDGRDGEYLENQELQPTHRVPLEPDDAAAGRDAQLIEATRILLEQVE